MLPFYNYLRSNLLLYIRYYFFKYMKAGLKLSIQKTKIMVPGPITSWQIDGGKMKTVTDFIFLDSKIAVDGNCSHGIKTLVPWKKSYDQPKQQRHHFADKGPYSHSCGFSSSHVWIWELDHEEAWALKSWCFQTVVLDKTLESPLDSKIKPVHPTDWFWSWNSNTLALMQRANSLEKTLMPGKTEGRRSREDEMVGRSVASDSLQPSGLWLPGSSVHGILQARILEWAAISFSRGSPQPRNRTVVSCISCIGRQVIYQLSHGAQNIR